MTFAKIDVDFRAFESFFTDINEKQVPFATSLALNWLANDLADAGNASIAKNFVVRRPWVTDAFVVQKISDKKESVISVTVQVKDNHALLNKFEEGGTKEGRDPSLPIAIPTSAIRGSFSGLAPLDMYPKNLGLMPRRGPTGEVVSARGRKIRNGTVQLMGSRRTFVMDPSLTPNAGKWGVWQRFGPGKHDIRMIWTFKRSIPIPRRLGFALTAQKTVDANWEKRFSEAWRHALRTAR